MKRNIIHLLDTWKKSSHRKPLILKGVRQSGKTWILREFGRTRYSKTAYFNFEENKNLCSLFKGVLEPKKLIFGLSALSGQKIKADDNLIIFDEIQECPEAITSLKYFSESAFEYHIACAGSLLGMGTLPGTSFPVGKVDFLRLFPLSFDEFLMAANEEVLLEYVKNLKTIEPLPEGLTDKLIGYLKIYFITGGMPEPVSIWFEAQDMQSVEYKQKNILESYENDFAKHVPPGYLSGLRLIWNAIPRQLSKENKKFFYGHLKSGARAKDFEDALTWLVNAGLVHRLNLLSKPGIPLSAYENQKAFKLYFVDVGLLRVKAGIPASIMVHGSDLFTEFKGALSENFALTELFNAGFENLGYWTSGAQAEVDLILQAGMHILPMEVKASINTKARSLSVYRDKFKPAMLLRSNLLNLKKEKGIFNIPLYLLFHLKNLLNY